MRRLQAGLHGPALREVGEEEVARWGLTPLLKFFFLLCFRCAPGYQGNPVLPNGKCVPHRKYIRLRVRTVTCVTMATWTLCDSS